MTFYFYFSVLRNVVWPQCGNAQTGMFIQLFNYLIRLVHENNQYHSRSVWVPFEDNGLIFLPNYYKYTFLPYLPQTIPYSISSEIFEGLECREAAETSLYIV